MLFRIFLKISEFFLLKLIDIIINSNNNIECSFFISVIKIK